MRYAEHMRGILRMLGASPRTKMLVPDHSPALEERRIGVRLEQVGLFLK
jgi:hypothetical protein